MAETTINTQPVVIEIPLTGLDYTHAYQIRHLQPATLFSIANRFLRSEFPPQRDYDLYLRLIQKGLLNPQLGRTQLQTLPLKSIEHLSQIICQISVHTSSDLLSAPPSPLDLILSFIIAIEETLEYDLQTILSEDLALLESHQQGSLHGYYFKPNQDPELLAHVLSAQGYRQDFLKPLPDNLSPHLAYWLCRRLSMILPWTALLAQFDTEQAQTFPSLYRLSKIAAYITPYIPKHFENMPAAFLAELPQVYQWIQEVFPQFSKEAKTPRPIQTLVLAEGNTEELLIPAIAKALGYDLYYEGILIQPVGGKNQMLQQYVNYAEHLAVPISILMDKDAQSLLPDLAFYQRPLDHIFILEEGEFEDIYTWELILKTLKAFYQPNRTITLAELKKTDGKNRVKALQQLWQELGLGLFNKVEFAQRMIQVMTSEKLLSSAMKNLIERILKTKQHAKTLSS